ncbi:MAG TPA: YhcN/YlaJ family sporulation lipoprotein [Bacilli bacterium]
MLQHNMLKLTLCGALALGSLTAAGCTNRAGNGDNEGIQPNNVRPRMTNNNLDMDQRLRGNATDMNRLNFNRWDNRRGNNVTSEHNNTRMEMSEMTANKIAAMKGIRSATVVLTENNAYVAVVLEDQRMNNLGDRARNNHMKGAPNMDNTMMQNNRMMGSQVTNRMKQRIGKQVSRMNPNVNNVYVSANPDFVSRMRGFAQTAQQGRPIRGLIIEFNDMVNRIFPTNAGMDGTGGTGNMSR